MAHKNSSKPQNQIKKAALGQPSPEMMEALKDFVRTKGETFLREDNISSVGIGYKLKDGKPTKEISIQFTVDSKIEPEGLDALGTIPIPKSFVINGVEVTTDVLERSFEASYLPVSETVENNRKTRIDPVVPGVSISNTNGTAGTIACFVFDRATGTPYVLSNWHVLNGPTGQIGDGIVQPGPFDDNRVQLNHLGTLVRSHLGTAGDCAISSLEGRGFKPEILELNVRLEELGEPELGDKVIKSGRTTGVTHGVVTRVHTMGS